MKTIIKNTIEKYKREQARIKKAIRETEWCIKEMSNTVETNRRLREELESLEDQALLIRTMINDLEIIGRGDE